MNHWMQRKEQMVVGGVLVAAMVALGGLTLYERGQGSKEIESTAPQSTAFLVDLNEADWAELAMLPGLGEERARQIVAYRKEHGGFRRTRELMRIKGIGEKTFEKLGPYLTPLENDAPAETDGMDEKAAARKS